MAHETTSFQTIFVLSDKSDTFPAIVRRAISISHLLNSRWPQALVTFECDSGPRNHVAFDILPRILRMTGFAFISWSFERFKSQIYIYWAKYIYWSQYLRFCHGTPWQIKYRDWNAVSFDRRGICFVWYSVCCITDYLHHTYASHKFSLTSTLIIFKRERWFIIQ